MKPHQSKHPTPAATAATAAIAASSAALVAAGRRLIASFSRTTASRGLGYFIDGRVRELDCQEPSKFTSLVEGSERYRQVFGYSDSGWQAQCSCPIQRDCKHIFAAMRAYLKHAERIEETKNRGISESLPTPSGPVKKPTVVQGPQRKTKLQLFIETVEGVLSRSLNEAEKEWSRRYYQLFTHIAQNGVLYVHHLLQYTDADEVEGLSGWPSHKSWTDVPKDPWLVWQHLSYYLHERKIPLCAPPTILAITDTSAIAAEQAAKIRSEEAARVENLARAFTRRRGNQISSRVFKARLVVSKDRFFLEAKSGEKNPFEELKRSTLRSFVNEAFNIPQRLHFDCISEPANVLLSLLTARYDSYLIPRGEIPEPRTKEAARWLARILESRFMEVLVVNEQRESLKKVEGSFSWLLEKDPTPSTDYTLRFVDGNGEPVRDLIAVIHEPRGVIVTGNSIFEVTCPLPDGLEVEKPISLSNDFVLSQAGLDFLITIKAKLPDDLEAQFPLIALSPRIEASLHSNAPSGEERLLISAKASAAGRDVYQLSHTGWHEIEIPKKGTPLRLDFTGLTEFRDVFTSLNLPSTGTLGEFRVVKSFAERFSEWLAQLPPLTEMKLHPPLDSFLKNDLTATARLQLTPLEKVDWFDLMLVVNLDDTQLSKEEIALLTSARGKFVRLPDRGWYRLRISLSPEDQAALLSLGLDASSTWESPRRVHRVHFSLPELCERAPQEVASKIIASFAQTTKISQHTSQHDLLRPYQREGVDFLGFLSANGIGGILADDMGLGKTIQTLAWLEWLTSNQKLQNKRPHLIVCPKSVVGNWAAEARRFCPKLTFKVLSSSDCSNLAEACQNTDAIVTGYASLRQYEAEFCAAEWSGVVLDEGQTIKNPASQISLTVCKLRSAHRLVLSGTPIENRLMDLWSLFRFCMPGLLGTQSEFKKIYGGSLGTDGMRFLGNLVRPFILRRSKSLVAKDLPEKTEIDHLCLIEGTQNSLYQSELKRAQQMLLAVKTQEQLNKIRFHVLSSLLRLRQICCHPKLVDEGLGKEQSAKLEAMLELVDSIVSEGNKVLVFSQFTEMLDLIAGALTERKIKFLTLTGKTENRTELVTEFQNNPSSQVFLISLRAGGFGLNLTAASYVILFEPWWNPAVENQAIDRTHRIGQRSPVTAYRLLVKDSIEEKMRLLHQKKTGLATGVLDEEQFSRALTVDDFRFLLGAGHGQIIPQTTPLPAADVPAG